MHLCDKNCAELGGCKSEWAGASGCLEKSHHETISQGSDHCAEEAKGAKDKYSMGPAIFGGNETGGNWSESPQSSSRGRHPPMNPR